MNNRRATGNRVRVSDQRLYSETGQRLAGNKDSEVKFILHIVVALSSVHSKCKCSRAPGKLLRFAFIKGQSIWPRHWNRQRHQHQHRLSLGNYPILWFRIQLRLSIYKADSRPGRVAVMVMNAMSATTGCVVVQLDGMGGQVEGNGRTKVSVSRLPV